ncbi:hypothetical protein CCP3SC15_580026 [Gammaproteobacteria bacterium]
MNTTSKWLRQVAEEIRSEQHNGWGNTVEQAADDFDALAARLAEYENVIIPSWKREEDGWREDEANAIEFRRVLAEELDKRDATIAQLRAWLRDYQPRPADEVKS